ncbi:hypothetical protein FKM82_018968 [Ascaphus truei]
MLTSSRPGAELHSLISPSTAASSALDQDLEGVALPVPRILENPPANNTLQAQNTEGDSAEDQTSPGCFCCIWRVRPKRSLFSSIRRWISKRRNRVVSF